MRTDLLIALFLLIGFAAAFVGMLVDVDRLRHEAELDELWDVDAVPNLTERPAADVPVSGVIGVDGGRSASGRVRLAAVDGSIGGGTTRP